MKSNIFEPVSAPEPVDQTPIPSLKKLVAPKKKGISTQRIAEVGVMSAALVVVFLVTAPVVDSLLPFVGCMIRTIAMAIFISGFRHYSGLDFFLINLFGSLIYFMIYPCLWTALSMPISITFVLMYNLFRRRLQPWLSVLIGVVFAYIVLIATLPFAAFNDGDLTKFWDYFSTTLKFSWALVLLVPLVWWRQKRNKIVSCTGCSMDCNTVSLDQ